MRGPVVVTGTGLVTPAGIGTEATWAGVCAGRPTARPDPGLDGLPVAFSARVPELGPEQLTVRQPWRYDRSTLLLFAAAQEALADAGLSSTEWDGTRVALVVGSAAGGVATLEAQHGRLLADGPGSVSPLTMTGFLPNMTTGHLALRLGITGPSLHTSTACASGASAVITAALLLATGQCDLALAAGTDAMVTPLCAAAFAKMGALSRRHDDPARASRPFDRDRDGFVLAEGAGVLVLEHAAHARARQARPLATLAGYAATGDAHHATAPDPEGTALRRAVTTALTMAGAGPADVDHINAHGTSTPLNDRAEAAAIRRLYPHHRPTVTSAKGSLGHTMGAAGAVEAVLTLLSVGRQLAPPTANFVAPDQDTDGLDIVAGAARPQRIDLALSHSLGFGGHNTVLAFTR
ncbi:beta-ketoacyl-[acyl-carrier-protein] synthase family protein [Kitasatospora sp. NBC_00070]|uniref:beta-ketoacyl-[acyl-carrier-protein] synthase family protein n=1 Tax=Kitasatospora sp. NBC_00070 TaxID=2975962 RepID=UPI0032482757